MTYAFKEWKTVCAALGRGDQSLILRKGGIAEGGEGFQFKHQRFFLFPTLFHAQLSKIRPAIASGEEAPPEGADAAREEITVDLFAEIDFHRVLQDWERVAALEPFHIWSEEEVRKRFAWDDEKHPGISLAVVRIHRLAEPWTFPNQRAYGGCRSWVTLPERDGIDSGMTAVLDEPEHLRVRREILQVLES